MHRRVKGLVVFVAVLVVLIAVFVVLATVLFVFVARVGCFDV